jgi:hypothetical protein
VNTLSDKSDSFLWGTGLQANLYPTLAREWSVWILAHLPLPVFHWSRQASNLFTPTVTQPWKEVRRIQPAPAGSS